VHEAKYNGMEMGDRIVAWHDPKSLSLPVTVTIHPGIESFLGYSSISCVNHSVL